MDGIDLFLAILAMGTVTYLPRALPLLALADRAMPPRLLRFLRGFPVAVLAAFAVPLVLAPEGSVEISAGNLALLVTLPTLLVARMTRSIIATVVFGSVLMAVFRLLGGG